MPLSAPIYVLKRKAKLLSRQTHIALHYALDKVAIDEGFQSWSHLASSPAHENPARKLLSQLEPCDLCLLGARPGQGKARLGLELAFRASQIGRKGYFFTLDYHERDIEDQFSMMGLAPRVRFEETVIDTSDTICVDHICNRLRSVAEPALVVVDYLQLLDQKRTNPSLSDQMTALRKYMTDSGAVCVVISQIDRTFDLSNAPMPGLADIRLPNPLDLTVFNKFFFLHDGKFRCDQAA